MMSVNTAEEDVTPVEVTHSPATASAVMATAAAVLAVLTSATAIPALGIAGFGLIGLAAGLFAIDSERAAAIGTAIVFLGVVLSGVYGNSTPMLVAGALATVLAFDLSQNAFSVGNQLSAQTDTTRGELVHAAASLAVGILIVGLAYGIYLAGLQGLTYGSLAFLLFGGLVLMWAIRA